MRIWPLWIGLGVGRLRPLAPKVKVKVKVGSYTVSIAVPNALSLNA